MVDSRILWVREVTRQAPRDARIASLTRPMEASSNCFLEEIARVVASVSVSQGAFASISVSSPFDPRSPQAAAIAELFTSTLVVCGVIFLIVAGLIAYCVVKFRGGNDDAEPEQIEGNKRLEIAWTLVPVAIVGGLLVLTLRAMNVSDPPIDRDPDITIIGHQWWWEARYPSGVVTANEIHIPTGKSLVVRIESGDVVHDFWVPELGRKIDAIPGRPTSIWMSASQSGTYFGACAEYCGVQHAWMRIMVVAESPEQFAAWEKHEEQPATRISTPEAARGSHVFTSMTCTKCHAIGGTGQTARVAPDLTHIAERKTLGAGILDNNPTELARWLKDPQAIKAGCHMPDTQLTDAEVADLVAYFETLK
jgi:cytochrome c oxidase subunit 2